MKGDSWWVGWLKEELVLVVVFVRVGVIEGLEVVIKIIDDGRFLDFFVLDFLLEDEFYFNWILFDIVKLEVLLVLNLVLVGWRKVVLELSISWLVVSDVEGSDW